MGPKDPVSTVLTAYEEALIITYRKYARLRLDDCLKRLRPLIPHLSRSALHRCFVRYRVSRLPAGRAGPLPDIDLVNDSGFVTILVCGLAETCGRGYLLCAVSDLTLFVYAKFIPDLNEYATADFLLEMINAAPFRLRSIDTPRRPCFAATVTRPWDARHPERLHPFRKVCLEHRISHLFNQGAGREAEIAKGWPKKRRRRLKKSDGD